MTSFRLIWAALFAAALQLLSASVHAQGYPAKPVTIVAPFPPGGGVDIFSRVLGQKLSERWGQPVLVVNRPGANTMIGTEFVAKSPPDGYTLLVTISGFTINPSLYKKTSYDPVRDFAPITQMSMVPLLLVVPSSSPAKSAADLVSLAKSKPGKLNYASIGTGSSTHLAGELFKTMTGVDAVHVPHKGAANALTELAAGRVDFLFIDNLAATPFLQDGRVRAIGVTSPGRSEIAPALAPVAEVVPGFEVVGWVGLFAPAGTSADIVKRIHDDVRAILIMADVRTRLSNMGPLPPQSTPAEFSELVRNEVTKWAKVIQSSGAQVD